MKKILFICVAALMAMSAAAQDETPTVNWPYLYPDFLQGEIMHSGGKTSKAPYNVHLGRGTLHFVEKGTISEASILSALYITIGEDMFRYVEGKLVKVIGEAQRGFVAEEALADYSAVVRNDGAYGGSLSNAAKGFSYDENYGNYGYLVTNNYEDLLSIKNESEALPVTKTVYLIIGDKLVQANKKSVSEMEGVDAKAFSAFLKSNGIKWKNPQDLVKVVDYITAD